MKKEIIEMVDNTMEVRIISIRKEAVVYIQAAVVKYQSK